MKDIHMKENSKIMKLVGLEHLNGVMEIFMKER